MEDAVFLIWKPINEDDKKSVRQNELSSEKEDEIFNEDGNEDKLIDESTQLHNADLDEIIDFFPRVLQNIKDEISNGVTWENIIKIPGLEDQISLTEKGINEDIGKFKKDILKVQKEKDAIIKKKKKELDANENKFIVKSKEIIKEFKKVFKNFCNDSNSGKISDEIKTQDSAVKYVGLEKLKNDLLEIEIWEKQKLTEFIKIFRKDVDDKNIIMQERTETLRKSLEAKKNRLKEKIGQIVIELKNKIEAYNEAIDKQEDEKEEISKDEKMEELSKIFIMTDFITDLEKITEVMDDRISKLRDQLDGARTASNENYFNKIMSDDYYRNKKKIQDIKEIYNNYWDKIKVELYNK